MIIDSHHHLWQYDPIDYGWIDGPLTSLRRDFLLPQLRVALAEGHVDGTVAVQARQTVGETRWLLELARNESAILGVVGWLPLASIELEQHLDALSGERHLVGLRHVVQDELPGFLADPDFNAGIGTIGRRGLTYDLLIYHHQLDEAVAFVDRHPQVRIVLDHIAKPPIAAGAVEPWATRIRDLAKREHVWCKLSGMVTEADSARWTESQLRPYAEVVLEAFGPQRLLFGSDWPVCLAGVGYVRWRELVGGWLATLSTDEQAAIWGGNAIAAYRLPARRSARAT